MTSRFYLENFQSTWAMERMHPEHHEWPFIVQCKMAAEAGFHGFNIDLDTPFMPSEEEINIALKDWGLRCSVVAFPTTIPELKYSLEKSAHLDATSLVVNARLFPYQPNQALDFVEEYIAAGSEHGIPVCNSTEWGKGSGNP